MIRGWAKNSTRTITRSTIPLFPRFRIVLNEDKKDKNRKEVNKSQTNRLQWEDAVPSTFNTDYYSGFPNSSTFPITLPRVALAITGRPTIDFRCGNNIRQYHTTPRRDIFPLVGLIALGVIGRYGYRAFNRMDDDMFEYDAMMKEYKGQKRRGNDSGCGEGTIGIDLGTRNLRLSFLSPSTEASTGVIPSTLVDSSGKRCTPWWYQVLQMNFNDGDTQKRSELVKELLRFNDPRNPTNSNVNNDNDIHKETVTKVKALETIASVAGDVLSCNLGYDFGKDKNKGGVIFASGWRDSINDRSKDNPLSSTCDNTFDLRPVFTYPLPCFAVTNFVDNNSKKEIIDGKIDMSIVPSITIEAAEKLCHPISSALFVSEPLAAIAGATVFGLIPPTASSSKTTSDEKKVQSSKLPSLVVDIGGTSTSISLVIPLDSNGSKNENLDSISPQKNDDYANDIAKSDIGIDVGHRSGFRVLYNISIPDSVMMSGEGLVMTLVDMLCREFYSSHTNNNEVKSTDYYSSMIEDPQGLIRIYEASSAAVLEMGLTLSSPSSSSLRGDKQKSDEWQQKLQQLRKRRVKVNIPYLGVEQNDVTKPRHLDVEIGIPSLEKEYVDRVLESLLLHNKNIPNQSSLSPSSSSSFAPFLSSSMPMPKNLEDIFTSAFTNVLEQSSSLQYSSCGGDVNQKSSNSFPTLQPNQFDFVLLTGCGSRFPAFVTAIGKAMHNLGISFVVDDGLDPRGKRYVQERGRLVVPRDTTTAGELVAIGAAFLGNDQSA